MFLEFDFMFCEEVKALQGHYVPKDVPHVLFSHKFKMGAAFIM